jgi:hypothetical protein
LKEKSYNDEKLNKEKAHQGIMPFIRQRQPYVSGPASIGNVAPLRLLQSNSTIIGCTSIETARENSPVSPIDDNLTKTFHQRQMSAMSGRLGSHLTAAFARVLDY